MVHTLSIAVGVLKTLNNKASGFNGRITEVLIIGPPYYLVVVLIRFHCISHSEVLTQYYIV